MSFAQFTQFTRTATRSAVAAIALSAATLTAPAQAQGDLLVAPTRVILDGKRGTEVILSNIGDEEATYRVGLELRRMLENGRLEPVAKEDADSKEEAALGMIRYAPRRVTLPPGQPQSIRLAARPDGDLPDGEYRVHMSFRAIPKANAVMQDTPADAQGVSIRLTPIYGVTIPIIVRHGRVQAQVALTQPRVIDDEGVKYLTLDLARAGESSTYGELRVLKPGVSDPVVLTRGLAVYPEVNSRQVRIPISPEQAAALTGQLRFEYREMPEAGGALIAAVDAALG